MATFQQHCCCHPPGKTGRQRRCRKCLCGKGWRSGRTAHHIAFAANAYAGGRAAAYGTCGSSPGGPDGADVFLERPVGAIDADKRIGAGLFFSGGHQGTFTCSGFGWLTPSPPSGAILRFPCKAEIPEIFKPFFLHVRLDSLACRWARGGRPIRPAPVRIDRAMLPGIAFGRKHTCHIVRPVVFRCI